MSPALLPSSTSQILYAFQPFVLTTCILQSWDNHPLYCVLFDLGAMSYSLSLYGLTSSLPSSIPSVTAYLYSNFILDLGRDAPNRVLLT